MEGFLMSGIAVFYRGEREMIEDSLSFLAHRGSETRVLAAGGEVGMGAVLSNAYGDDMNVFEGPGEYVVFDGFLRNCSDAPWPEKILSLRRKYGNRFIDRLDGSFAFAIHTAGETLIARDPLGLKPLYYCFINGSIACAPELKASDTLL